MLMEISRKRPLSSSALRKTNGTDSGDVTSPLFLSGITKLGQLVRNKNGARTRGCLSFYGTENDVLPLMQF